MSLTVDGIIARCLEDGDCLIWPGAKSGDGSPCASDGAPRNTVRLRRWLWEQVKGPLKPGINVTMNGPKGCGHALCLNTEHMLPVTKTQQMQFASKRGLLTMPLERLAHQQRIKREQAKLDIGKARTIRSRRAAGETLKGLAADFGVHHSLIERTLAALGTPAGVHQGQVQGDPAVPPVDKGSLPASAAATPRAERDQ